MVAVINNEGGFYSRELYFHELKRAGANLHLPCVNRSDEFTNITGKDVFMGLRLIDGLQITLKERILDERLSNGIFKDLPDFIERTAIGIEQLNSLIQIGALRFTKKNKKQLLWQANFIQKKSNSQTGVNALFTARPVEFELPELTQHPLDDAMDELELLGFPLCNPFLLADDTGVSVSAANLAGYLGQMVTVVGYLITMKPVRTIKQENMFFGTFIDAAGNWLDTVHFPQSAKKYPLQGRGYYRMTGKVIEEFGCYAVDVFSMVKIGIKPRNSVTIVNNL